jgi:hypothetical protein
MENQNMVQLYVIHPIGTVDLPGFGGGLPAYGGGHPSQGLPGSPGHPSQGLPWGPGHVSPPIFHPGHPDHGLPSSPGHIGNQLPWSPGHPDAGLPVPPGVDAPPVPPHLAEQVIVLWHLPGQVEWHGKVIDPSLSAGMPLPPAPEPKV